MHAADSVQRGNKVHLARARIREAVIDPASQQCMDETFSAVHRILTSWSPDVLDPSMTQSRDILALRNDGSRACGISLLALLQVFDPDEPRVFAEIHELVLNGSE